MSNGTVRLPTTFEKSFFNKMWSDEQIIEAVTQGYNYALSMGVITEKVFYEYAGEYIVLCFKNGVLHTAYGLHRYGMEELLALLG